MEYWKIVPEFEQYVYLQPVESRVSRALLMLSSSKAYNWVLSIATEAYTSPTNDTWVGQLARDVKREWRKQSHNTRGPEEVIFDSEDYLPSLTVSCKAVVILERWVIKDEEEGFKIIQIISIIIETWFQFPTSRHTNNNYNVRCALISIVTKYMPLSVLLLDDIWKMYVKPHQFVIHGRAQNQQRQRISHSHTEKTVALFEKAIQKHAMAQRTSEEYNLLMVLNKYSESWYQLSASRTQTENQHGPSTDDVRFFLNLKISNFNHNL
jgi:hypothetical protein